MIAAKICVALMLVTMAASFSVQDAWKDLMKSPSTELSAEKKNQLQQSFFAIHDVIEADRKNISAKARIAAAFRASPVCPSASTISPCTCSSDYLGTGVSLSCYNKGLTDAQFSTILDAFLACGISPLTSLSASGNSLTIVPNQILKFTSLWNIDLSNNKITSMPAGAFSYPSATFLYVYLYVNQITSIPSDAFNSPKATSISVLLYNNQITSIPSGMFKYPSATSVSIYLASNKIPSIPAGMFDYPLATSVFIVIYSNQITAIPAGMFNYPSARSVGILLPSNQITSIPAGIFNYPSLTGSISMWLHGNRITSIPTGMFNYPSATGVQMLLSSNQITSIPSGTFNYPKATSMTLWLDYNQIPSIPANTINFPIANNVQATFSSNSITNVEAGNFQAGNFSYVSFSNNKLTQFPSTIYKAPLKIVPTASTFMLSSNPIDCSNCNLAWLIRDNRQLMTPISGGTCSNGTTFANLNPYGYTNCAVDC